MTAEDLYFDTAEFRGTYYDNFIARNAGHIVSEEAIDIYYDNLVAYNMRKKQRLDVNIGIRAARKRIVRVISVAVIMAVMLSAVINLKAELTNREAAIESLTAQVEELSRENTDKKKRLTENTNILSIKQRAMELGMDYAKKEAVVYYTVGKEDYMRSYTY
ncbi:MAG: hypothetical protein IKQ56_08655 [Lachnospiraceae bacterium]|nr:hypothetical protein [Lachnospiraceae bacterium]